jgi:short-subunit dehydrogenase
MDTNYGGMLRTFEAVIPGMLERGTGTLVGVASLAGYRGLPTSAAYGASKAAMIHFMESMRFHLEKKGVSVVVVNPGFVQTPMTEPNTFPMPSLVTASFAAQDILRQLTNGKTVIAFPWVFSRIMGITRIIPYSIYSWLVRLLWSRMKHGNESR